MFQPRLAWVLWHQLNQFIGLFSDPVEAIEVLEKNNEAYFHNN